MDALTSDKAEADKVSSSKRQATRQLLLDAAHELVLDKGHDKVSIEEITNRAKLSKGTYYNYFDTKQDVFMAVAQGLRDQLAAELRKTTASIKDPAMKVALTQKYYFYQSLDNRDWREFTRFTGLTHLSLEQAMDERIEDIQWGVKAGRFKVDNVHFTESLIRGMSRHVIAAIDKGDVEQNASDYATRSILQMLGLPEIVAKALTQTRLPPIPAQRRRLGDAIKTDVVTPLSEYQSNPPRAEPTA
jgi:AcrR family transcriptional regulator